MQYSFFIGLAIGGFSLACGWIRDAAGGGDEGYQEWRTIRHAEVDDVERDREAA